MRAGALSHSYGRFKGMVEWRQAACVRRRAVAFTSPRFRLFLLLLLHALSYRSMYLGSRTIVMFAQHSRYFDWSLLAVRLFRESILHVFHGVLQDFAEVWICAM